MFEVERLLEKYFQDLRHVETERHWFLGAYAVIVAGTLAFLPQLTPNGASWKDSIPFLALVVLSGMGFVHALRSAWTLELIQNEIKRIVEAWEEDPSAEDPGWRTRWMWPKMRGYIPSDRWWKDAVVETYFLIITSIFLLLFIPWNWRRQRQHFPPTFTTVGILVYVLGFIAFLGLAYTSIS